MAPSFARTNSTNQMKNKKIKWTAAGVLASVAFGTSAIAQSSDALLDKLVEKGILTTKEANELKDETDKGFTTAYQVKSGMPDWVTALKFNGDFRGRFEGFYAETPAFVDRNRFRYRVRFGATATLQDDFEIGLRLSSGDPVGGFSVNSGNPVSGNTTLQDNASRKFIYVDLAYAKWAPIHTPDWSGSVIFGKMENPFVFSHIVLDPDYNPEGLALQLAYNLNAEHSLKLSAGAFVLDELAASSYDPYLGAAQLRFDSTWNKKIATSLGVSALAIKNDQSLVNGNVPNVNRGNTRDVFGAPASNFNPIVGDASLTYTLESFPAYTGAFPIKAGGDFLYNGAAESKNKAFSAGVTFGKAGKKGLWEISYQYRYLGADSWYEELPDDDFGGFYVQQQPNAGFTAPGAGYGGGTNLRGHFIKATYSPYDSMAFSLTYYNAKLIDPDPTGSRISVGHLLVDVMWKF